MTETIQPPTDNLYKFLAIGGLLVAVVAFVVLVREQARHREQYIQSQVELSAAGYVEGSGIPTDPEQRRAYFRREFATWEAAQLFELAEGLPAGAVVISLVASIAGFVLWWIRVQRYDDTILRLTATKLERELSVKSD